MCLALEQRKVGDFGEIVTGNTPLIQKQEYYSDKGILFAPDYRSAFDNRGSY